MKPKLDERGVKLFLVSIGTYERSKDFLAATQFPAESFFADPENAVYDALGTKKGVAETFLSYTTPLAIKKRMDEGKLGDLGDILQSWKMFNPPRMDQALNQGGMFVFRGRELVWSHLDQSTGDHADLGEVLGIVAASSPPACSCD